MRETPGHLSGPSPSSNLKQAWNHSACPFPTAVRKDGPEKEDPWSFKPFPEEGAQAKGLDNLGHTHPSCLPSPLTVTHCSMSASENRPFLWQILLGWMEEGEPQQWSPKWELPVAKLPVKCLWATSRCDGRRHMGLHHPGQRPHPQSPRPDATTPARKPRP